MTDEIDRARLDEAALDRLRELDPDGRHGVLPRVLRAFDGSLSNMLSQLRTTTDAGKAKLLTDVAHKLKSSAASVGALNLAKACAEIEHLQRVDPGHDMDASLRRLITEAELALQAVRAMLLA